MSEKKTPQNQLSQISEEPKKIKKNPKIKIPNPHHQNTNQIPKIKKTKKTKYY